VVLIYLHYSVDDYESVKGVWKLISFMFLSMLITLEDEDLLDPGFVPTTDEERAAIGLQEL